MTFSNSAREAPQRPFHYVLFLQAATTRAQRWLNVKVFVDKFQNHKISDAAPDSLSLVSGVSFSLWKVAGSSCSLWGLWDFMICFLFHSVCPVLTVPFNSKDPLLSPGKIYRIFHLIICSLLFFFPTLYSLPPSGPPGIIPFFLSFHAFILLFYFHMYFSTLS